MATKGRVRSSRATLDTQADQRLADIRQFLSRIPHQTLAKAATNCKSYSRALKHIELHIRDEENRGKGNDVLLPWFGQQLKLFASLDDADSMEGLSARILTPALDQEVLQHEAAGRWTAAQSCYEMLLQQDPDNIDYQLGLLKCQRNLGHFGEAVSSRLVRMRRLTRRS